MKDYFEIEIIDKDGNKFYEIAQSRSECFILMRLHNGVSMKGVNNA